MAEKKSITFSYSQFSAFNSCREKYKIIYIDGIRKPHVSIEAFMGICVHKVLEWIYLPENQDKPYFTFDELCRVYDEVWVDSWHDDIYIASLGETKDLYYSIGKRCLSNYYSEFGPHFVESVKNTELELVYTTDENFKVKGVIDRLDEIKPGKFEIHDYKTGKRMKTARAAKKDLQLGIYQLAVEQNYAEVEDVRVNWHFVRHGKLVSASNVEKDLNKLRSRIDQEIKEINNAREENNFYPTETLLCHWCYLWEECSAKTGSNPARKAK